MNDSVLDGLECEKHSKLSSFSFFLELRILKAENVDGDDGVLCLGHPSDRFNLIHLPVSASFKYSHSFLM